MTLIAMKTIMLLMMIIMMTLLMKDGDEDGFDDDKENEMMITMKMIIDIMVGHMSIVPCFRTISTKMLYQR